MGPVVAFLSEQSWVNCIVEGSFTWRPLIDDVYLQWPGCIPDGLIIASLSLFLVSSYLSYSIWSRELHQKMIYTGDHLQCP